MNRRHFYHTITTAAAVAILAVAGFGQGKGHGGGNPHGGGEKHGGGGDGRGQEMRVQQPGAERGHGNNGNGNGWGRRGNDERQVWQQQQQQRQNEWNARRQQQDAYRQQQQAMRQQQEYYRQQQRQQYEAQRQYQNQQGNWNDDRGRGHGKKNGWSDDGPRGNAYGRRGIWPGEFRGWRDPEKQDRKAEKELRRSSGNYNAYAYDPFTAFMPRIYRERYQQPNYAPQYYGGYATPQYYGGYTPQYYGYSPNYYPSGSGHSTRDAIVRTVLSAFFGGGDQYYDNAYYGQSAYSPYYGYSSNYYPYQTSYNPLGYSYYPAGYAYSTSSYYPSNYSDPYYSQPIFGSGLFGGGGLKSTLLNVGLSMLQGFMGQGYEDGIYAGQYARRHNINEYYDPYTYDSPAYYSPYVSSLGNERQAFDEGYRLGYADAMRNQDPYGALQGRAQGVDLLTEFLSSGLLG